MKKKTICFIAGRSGGHIKPALTLAQKYRQENPDGHIVFFTTTAELDQKIIHESNQELVHIPLPLENIPQKKLKYPWYMLQALWCTIKSFIVLQKHRPEKIISMGGYISLPVCLAAKLLFIPIELFELNALPGKAAKIVVSLCTKIQYCFKNTEIYFPKNKAQFAVYPLQFQQANTISQKTAIQQLHLFPDKKTVLILGGSQGSVFINNLMKMWLEKQCEYQTSLQVIHQTGNHDTFDWKEFYTSKYIPSRVFGYSNEMELYYQAADLIICRAGAGTLFEALFFKKPCIVIPLQTHSTNHQVYNAQALAREYPEFFTILDQKKLIENAESFFSCANALLENKNI